VLPVLGSVYIPDLVFAEGSHGSHSLKLAEEGGYGVVRETGRIGSEPFAIQPE
jgi:hypothetical protein